MADNEMQEEEDEVEEGAPAWMATYSDLATLLLTFFVLLLSFANMDVQHFQSALGSIKEAMGVQHEHPGDKLGLTTSIVELSKRESTDNLEMVQEKVAEMVKSLLKSQNLDKQVEVEVGNRGIIVRVTEFVLFGPGEARLRKGAAEPLTAIAVLAHEIKLPVWIEGHTDDRPIHTVKFPSNWELSAARATAALKFLNESQKVPLEKLSIGGYADTRPLEPNDTPEGRARNRRVEFLFVKPPRHSVDQYKALVEKKERLKKELEARMREARRRVQMDPTLEPEPEPEAADSAEAPAPAPAPAEAPARPARRR